MVQAYWQVGRLIVEHEQAGRTRAEYGAAVLDDLAERLTTDFGRGFDARNLRYMRQSYLAFPMDHAIATDVDADSKWNALRSKSNRAGKQNAARSKLSVELESPGRRPELSWTHYRLLLSVEDRAAREWYIREAAEQHWSTRRLERQISVLYYERLLASRKKAPVRKEAAAKLAKVEAEHFIRDPYVLGFLDLKDYPALRESGVEQAIIDNLQAFRLELGKGFTPGQAEIIELKLALAEHVRALRSRLGMTQAQAAHRLGSSTSRVAKMEAADPSVSLDLLIRALCVLGASRKEIARVIASRSA